MKNKIFTEEYFNELNMFFNDLGYTTKISNGLDKYTEISGKGIKGIFALPSSYGYYGYHCGYLYVDNSRSFDKWTTASMIIKLPMSNRLKKALPDYLCLLGSEEGYAISVNFDPNCIFPKEI